jgi:hypothetical protein
VDIYKGIQKINKLELTNSHSRCPVESKLWKYNTVNKTWKLDLSHVVMHTYVEEI